MSEQINECQEQTRSQPLSSELHFCRSTVMDVNRVVDMKNIIPESGCFWNA
jgi:hypothetical protein